MGWNHQPDWFREDKGGLASMQLCIFGIGDRQQAMLEPLYLAFVERKRADQKTAWSQANGRDSKRSDCFSPCWMKQHMISHYIPSLKEFSLFQGKVSYSCQKLLVFPDVFCSLKCCFSHERFATWDGLNLYWRTSFFLFDHLPLLFKLYFFSHDCLLLQILYILLKGAFSTINSMKKSCVCLSTVFKAHKSTHRCGQNTS